MNLKILFLLLFFKCFDRFYFKSFSPQPSCFWLFQSPEALCRRYLRGPGSQPRLPHGDVHLLCGLLRGVPLLLRQHICGFDHHHLSGAGRQGHVRVQPGKERGLFSVLHERPSFSCDMNTRWLLFQQKHCFLKMSLASPQMITCITCFL